ncbi:MAG: glutamine--tRNA ligase [Candidatus Marinimicrobia bacterium]|nr:glutamine--tRNA ligase [Candidatus Neomarinimicrobiota bacterium]
MSRENTDPLNFIQKIINQDNKSGKYNKRVHTRFPPEPNGYLHIGHAKSICLNFGIAEKYNGKCNLRFDDTNPLKEEKEYVNSIIEDVKWLGFDWEDRKYYASDYFEKLYTYALQLISKGKAYVCDLSPEEMRNQRGTLKHPGKASPFRNRSIDENIGLFKGMRAGKFKDSEKTLRARIDMSHSNINMRDPVMYRVLNAPHHRTGNDWCIYPMYDWAHGLEDSIEKITHSICTLEFEDHRLLYEWYLNALELYQPQQIEFARLNLSYTIMSKRKLKFLVDNQFVDGWDDPRMPTISGLRRRGYTKNAVRNFAEEVGITKRDSIIDAVRLENALRSDLNKRAPRAFAVIDPIKVVITNFPDIEFETLQATNNPEKPSEGKRDILITKEIYIERSDFIENPPKKFFRLGLEREVRLRFAYFIKCHSVLKNKDGEIKEIHCTYDPQTKGGSAPDGRKVKGTIHWVSVDHSINAEIRLYDRLFNKVNPNEGGDYIKNINQNSFKVYKNAKLELSLKSPHNKVYQFERNGYFIQDSKYSKSNRLIFNRAVSLRDSWAKILANKNK